MDKVRIHPYAIPIRLKGKDKWEIFLIHGYTASPADFNNLSGYLYRRFKIGIYIPLLKGHGTTIEDLYPYNFEDFLKQIEDELKKELKKGKKIIIGGTSFGAQLALILASKYPVYGVFSSTAPHKFKFPISFRPLMFFRRFFKSWDKDWRGQLSDQKEIKIRKKSKAFFYRRIPTKSMDIMDEANEEIKKIVTQIKIPTLIIQSINDPTVNFEGAKELFDKIPTKEKKFVLFNEKKHNLFFTPSRKKVNKVIGDFVASVKYFK